MAVAAFNWWQTGQRRFPLSVSWKHKHKHKTRFYFNIKKGGKKRKLKEFKDVIQIHAHITIHVGSMVKAALSCWFLQNMSNSNIVKIVVLCWSMQNNRKHIPQGVWHQACPFLPWLQAPAIVDGPAAAAVGDFLLAAAFVCQPQEQSLSLSVAGLK